MAMYAKPEGALSKEEVNCEICTDFQFKAEAFCRQCDKFVCEKCVESHQRMKAIFDGHEIVPLDELNSKEEVNCEICTDFQFKAEAFCRQCDKFVCEKCVESHQRMKAIFDGHEIVPLDELKGIKSKDLLNKNPPSKKCQLHQELLKMFCFDCNRLICRCCTVKDHKDHNWVFNHIAAKNKRKELMDSLKPLRDMAVRLSCTVDEIETTERELVVQGKSVAYTIETSHEKLIMVVERHKQQLLEEASRKVSGKMENLRGQKKNMSINVAEVQSILDNSEQNICHCSDNEVMCVDAEIESQVKRGIEEHDKPEKNIVPVEEVDVGVEVRCAEALEQLCLTKTKITRLPVTFVIKGIVSNAEVNKLSDITFYTTILCNNKPTKRGVQVDCHLKSLYNGSLFNSGILEIKGKVFRIQYIPTVRGRHELIVSVDGQQEVGSPFPVFVSIPPTELDYPVKIWGGIREPNGLTFNSVSEIIVTECRGDVVVLDRDGTRLRSIDHTEYQFQGLNGVTVDSEDNIYFTDLDTNRIFKSDKNCSKVEVTEVIQTKGPGHIDIAVVGDEVMVTERFNEGEIMVYDRELKYVRQIGGADINTLYCISHDSCQNVYVSEDAANVLVFSNDGDYLCSIGCGVDRVNMLKAPLGVCVAGRYVYVADYGVDMIVVFTTEGKYVTSFASECKHDVICVDQDGFVYACNYGHNRIEVY